MAIILNKPKTPTVGAANKPTTPSKPASVPSKPGTPPKPPPSGLSFVKRGKAAQVIADQEDKKAEMRSKGSVFRFWLPADASTSITFLDGNLVDGILDIPFYHEHQINMGGSWRNWFICTQDDEPCPICEGGAQASYVGAMTIIDHSEYTSKKDGQVKKDEVKLFVAKRETIKLLQKYAVKRGGLRGCTFDVSRVGDKSPGVGSSFDFTEKLTEAELNAKYKAKGPKDIDRTKAVEYDKHLAAQYQPASELRKLGFGSSASPVGSESPAGGEDYDV